MLYTKVYLTPRYLYWESNRIIVLRSFVFFIGIKCIPSMTSSSVVSRSVVPVDGNDDDGKDDDIVIKFWISRNVHANVVT